MWFLSLLRPVFSFVAFVVFNGEVIVAVVVVFVSDVFVILAFVAVARDVIVAAVVVFVK